MHENVKITLPLATRNSDSSYYELAVFPVQMRPSGVTPYYIGASVSYKITPEGQLVLRFNVTELRVESDGYNFKDLFISYVIIK